MHYNSQPSVFLACILNILNIAALPIHWMTFKRHPPIWRWRGRTSGQNQDTSSSSRHTTISSRPRNPLIQRSRDPTSWWHSTAASFFMTHGTSHSSPWSRSEIAVTLVILLWWRTLVFSMPTYLCCLRSTTRRTAVWTCKSLTPRSTMSWRLFWGQPRIHFALHFRRGSRPRSPSGNSREGTWSCLMILSVLCVQCRVIKDVSTKKG